MVIVTYFAIVLSSVTQSLSAKLYHRRSCDAAAFNLIKAVTALLLFVLMAISGFQFHMPTLLWGLFYGACQCTSMYAGYKALCLGPMALTSMLVSFSVVIPLLWGLTVGEESLRPSGLFGLILLLLSMILVNADRLSKRRGHAGGHVTKGRYGVWPLLVGLTFLCNGACSILQKQHGMRYPDAYTREFMLFAMLVCAVFFSVTALAKNTLRGIGKIKGKRFGALAGVAMGLSGFFTLSLAGLENASVLFPMISGGTMLGVLLFGRFLLKEKLKINHYAALLFGIAAVVLLKL